MKTWTKDKHGNREFMGGLENWALASKIALDCDSFFPDDDDEQVSDEPTSCYNCKYRRWGTESFTCLRQMPDLFVKDIYLAMKGSHLYCRDQA